MISQCSHLGNSVFFNSVSSQNICQIVEASPLSERRGMQKLQMCILHMTSWFILSVLSPTHRKRGTGTPLLVGQRSNCRWQAVTESGLQMFLRVKQDDNQGIPCYSAAPISLWSLRPAVSWDWLKPSDLLTRLLTGSQINLRPQLMLAYGNLGYCLHWT